MSETHTLDGYFQEYRNKLQELDSVKQMHREMHIQAEQKLSQIRQKYDKTFKEINDMRKVISLIVDKGLDPVEAKLTVENYPDMGSIWATTPYDYNPLDEVNITLTDATMHATTDISDSYSMTSTYNLKI